MKKIRYMILALTLIGMLINLSGVSAGQYLGSVQITCTDFTAAGTGAAILDRDNTGAGQEAEQIIVKDGYNTVIYSLTFQNALGTYSAGLINTTSYTTPPQANPITVTVISLAGNGLPQQIDFTVSGSCPGLPTVGNSLPCQINDGRINNLPGDDCGATVAIYLKPLRVLAINPVTHRGEGVITLTQEEIDAVGVPTESNVLLAQGYNPYTSQLISVYRLTTGEFQLNTWQDDNKPYTVVWDLNGNLYYLEH
ncbi:MAG: hypothetical protein R3E39_07050 [Anaerolineae bacterium]